MELNSEQFRSFMYTSSMINSDKFRFVVATAKQSIYDTQLPSQPRIGESAFTMQIQKEKSLDDGSLIRSHAFLTQKDPDFVKTIALLNKYYDVIFFNNLFKPGRGRIQS